MNSSQENKNEKEIIQSKRHKSVITPSMNDIQLFESNDIISNNQNQPSKKIKLRSNSLFAYQEFDKYISLFGINNNIQYTSSSNNSSDIDNSEEDDEFSDNIHQSNQTGKKISDGNIFYPPSNNNLYNVFNSNHIKENNLNKNINGYSYLQNMYDLRRNSLGLLPNFLYYNYSFQNPYQGFSPYLNNNLNGLNNNNNQFNSNTINNNNHKKESLFKRNSCNFQQPWTNNQDYYSIFNKLQDQVGCRQLQEKLEEKKNDNNFIQQFYKCIEGNLTNVINHQFGNYVVQKLFDIFLSKNNKKMITNFFSQIKHDLIIISLHNYGTRVFQKILEKLERGKYLDIETEELDNIFKKLIEQHICDLCPDINGNHVFQKIVKIFPKDKNNFIFEKLAENAFQISKLKQGASIFENCFLIATKNQKDKVVYTIINDMTNIINDEYGNYTIQLLVSFHNEEYNKIIFDYFKKNLVLLSNQKFSSNVIDRAIIQDNQDSISLINYMINNKLVKDLIVDQYGNYVVQKALSISNGNTFIQIIEQIKPMIEKLKSTSIGRKIFDHLNHQYGNFFK
jgi:hypothetical protein